MKNVVHTGYRGFTAQNGAARLCKVGTKVDGLVQGGSDCVMEFCCELRCVSEIREATSHDGSDRGAGLM